MRVLSVTYALTPLSTAACGGTEQIAATLLELHARAPYDHRLQVTTVAPAASRIPGRWIPTNSGYWQGGAPAVNDAAQQSLATAHDAAALAALHGGNYDLVHIQGASFYHQLGEIGTPILLSLHLPLSHYPPGSFGRLPPHLWLQAVSRTQYATLRERLPPAAGRQLTGYIANGVDLGRYRPGASAAAYWLWLGRICPEKAPHLAIELARRCGRRLILAGVVYPFPAHQEYFRRQVAPHLGGDVRWLSTLSQEGKIACLQAAAAVVIPSQAEETSSLVAMEAAACGRPVLAWRSGALGEIVREGETGWLGNSLDELAAAARRLHRIEACACRRHAIAWFDARRMAADYFALYQRLARGRGRAPGAPLVAVQSDPGFDMRGAPGGPKGGGQGHRQQRHDSPR